MARWRFVLCGAHRGGPPSGLAAAFHTALSTTAGPANSQAAKERLADGGALLVGPSTAIPGTGEDNGDHAAVYAAVIRVPSVAA